MVELVYVDLFIFKEKMGVIGVQLYVFVWRIDCIDFVEEVLLKDKSLGNLQVLLYDYMRVEEIEVVI